MEVININADGQIIEDLSEVTVPTDNNVYDVCLRLVECQSCTGQSG